MKKIYQILHKLGSTSRITNTNLDLSTIEEKRVKWMWFSSKFCEVQDVTHKLYERNKSFGEFGRDEERNCKGFVGSQSLRNEFARTFLAIKSLRNERVEGSIYRMRARVVVIWSFCIW